MARVKITQEIIIKINDLYLEKGTYAAVAREVGISPSTVKKYILPDYVPATEIVMQTLTVEEIRGKEDFVMSQDDLTNPYILLLSPEEEEDMKKLWEMLAL